MRRSSLSYASRWVETQAAGLGGLTVIGPTPGLVWLHGLGGSSVADSARGLDELLRPESLNRTVLRLDLRGHGLSAHAHDAQRGTEQYTWQELAKDMRLASRAAMSRAFLGGEAMGAAVALHAAVAATATGSVDAPPGLILMRPPAGLAEAPPGEAASDCAAINWRERSDALALAAEEGTWEAVEAREAQTDMFMDGASAIYSQATGAANLLQEYRRSMPLEVFATALRGHAASQLPQGLEVLATKRSMPMAAEAYGVPITLQCPVLVLAVEADIEHSLQAAERLAAALPDAELEVASSLEDARAAWPAKMADFMRRAWMKEFLTKRVMPQ